MNPTWRRFAPIGLYIAGLATLVSAGIFLVMREWNLPLQISLGMIVVGLAVFVILDPQKTREMLTGRQARYGSNAFILSVAFIGILVVINYLVYNNSKRWDFTEDKRYTLAPETIATLGELKEPVKALAFYSARISSEQAKSLLNEYQYNAKGKFTYQFIDPEANPVAAQQANITRDGTVVLQMGTRREPITSMTEQEVTAGLVKLINPETRTVYFLTGHGEHDPNGSGDTAYSTIKGTLESKNYAVKTLNLLAENKIPEDARVIVIAGPQKPLTEEEVTLLNAYMTGKGGLVVLEEPLPLTQYGDNPDPLADFLNQSWGVEMGNDIVVDVTSQQPFAPFAAQYGNHAITQKIQQITTVFPTARSVKVTKAPEGISGSILVFTAQQSWSETDLANLQDKEKGAKFDQGQDTQGPISLVVAVENLSGDSRLVAIGDSDFAANAYVTNFANMDLLINSIDWVSGQENLISLTPKTNTQRVMVAPKRITMNLIFLGSVILIPGIMLAGGIAVWFQRRRRG